MNKFEYLISKKIISSLMQSLLDPLKNEEYKLKNLYFKALFKI